MGYSIRLESIIAMKQWLELLEQNKDPILLFETQHPDDLLYKLNQALASAQRLNFPKFQDLRKIYKFKATAEGVQCYRKDITPEAVTVSVNYPDASDFFDIIDAYAQHSGEHKLRFPNANQSDVELINWLTKQNISHEWTNGKLYITKVSEPSES